jgi:predicted SnoaL-like aldol condensation-catalyzing enzyme
LKSFSLLCSAVVLAGSGMAWAAMPSPDDQSPLCQANKKVAVAFMQTVFADHHVKEAFDKYVGDTFVEHRPMPTPGVPTRDTVFKGLSMEFANGGGPSFHPVSAVAEGDLVFVKSSDGDLVVFRVQDGKLVEHWQGE